MKGRDFMGKRLVAALAAAFAFNATAEAQSISVMVDADYADFLPAKTCSHEEIDEAAVRAMPVVQSQVKHHANLTGARDMEAFLAGLKAAAKCEVPENDVYEFGPLVKEKKTFRAAVDYFKDRSADLEVYVAESLSPYVPADDDYKGELVLSVVGNNCGGFAMDGRFYLALSCIRDDVEGEFEAAKIMAAHETFHALQYEFFYPFNEDISAVKSRNEAFDYLFMNLLTEGTAEFAASTKDVEGDGVLSGLTRRFARNGYRQAAFHIRTFGYMADILNAGDDPGARLKDVYNLGFGGQNRQVFYYAGAVMAAHVDKTYGREALICIVSKPPEQFVRAYEAAARERADVNAPPLAPAMMKAAERLSRKRAKDLHYERCIE